MRKAVWTLLALSAPLALSACGEDRNEAPTVALEAQQSQAEVGDEVVVSGEGSSDPDGDPLLFRWSLAAPSGSSVTLDDPRTEVISFVPDTPGSYTVRLSVDDGEFESSTERVSIEVARGENVAPVADAGADQSVAAGDVVSLDGTASSDPNGDELTYQWSFAQRPPGSNAAFDDATTATPSFTADVAGDYIVGLVVSDGELDSERDTVTISAAPGENRAPVADAGPDQSVDVNAAVILDGTGSSDPDGDTLSFFWSFVSKPDDSFASLNNATTDQALLEPDLAGTYEIQLEVSDGQEISTDTITIVAEQTTQATCLIFGEYIEDGSNKGVELFNCSGQQLDLTDFGVCMARGADTICSELFELTGLLDAGDVYTMCYNRPESTLLAQSLCDFANGRMSFSGDDRLFIYENTDGSPGYSRTDIITDAFGQIDDPPGSEIWADLNLRRCNFDRYDGQGDFDFRTYYDEAAALTDYSNFGQPPSEGCGQ